MMDALVKQQWIDALRSGNYRQKPGVLMIVDIEGGRYYCPNGVLCEMYDPNYFAGYQLVSGFPSDEVLGWAGLTFSESITIANLNDCNQHDSDTIAKWIEDNL
jgi:hypothetical protein